MPEVSAIIEGLTAQLRDARQRGTALHDRLFAKNGGRPRPDFSHLDDPGLMERIAARGAADFAAYQAAHPELAGDDGLASVKPVRKRRPLVFRERDVTRAIAANLKAGLGVKRVEIDSTGRIVIVTGEPERTEIAPTSANEWDEVLTDGAH